MQRLLLSIVMTAVVGSSVRAASGQDDARPDDSQALAAKSGHPSHAPKRPGSPARPAARASHAAHPPARTAPGAHPATRPNHPGRESARPPQAGRANTHGNQHGHTNIRPNHTGQAAPGHHGGHTAVRPHPTGYRNAPPGHAGRADVRPNRTGHPARPGNQVPNWGKAPRILHAEPPPHGWHVRGARGTFIAKNYPDWSSSWWSAKWGRWFRFDPETSAYYYYEPVVDAYAEIETITTYRRPLEVPIPEAVRDGDDISDEDDPPPPVEP